MTNINLLAELIREEGRARDWTPVVVYDWTASDYKIPCFLALLHSEICEAFAETISDSPDAFLAAELADIQIRTLDLAGGLTTDFAHYVTAAREEKIAMPNMAQEAQMFNLLHMQVTNALEAFRRDNLTGTLGALGQLYVGVAYMANNVYGIDLAVAVDRKMEVNRARSAKHGGKRV